MAETNQQSAGFIGIGIIGTGEITRIMRPAFTESTQSRVVAVADVNMDAARVEAEALGGAEVFADYRELLASPAVQAVYIATPSFLHREMVLEAMAAGKHVLCEKPFMLNQAEAREIAAAHAACPDLKVASCSSRFHNSSPVIKARELVASGKLECLTRVRFLQTQRPSKPEASDSWKTNRAAAGGGRVMDWGVYDLDWMLFLLGEQFDPTAVFARVDNSFSRNLETGFSAEIFLKSGVSVAWERRDEQGPAINRVEVRGTGGGFDLPFIPGGMPDSLTFYHYDEKNTLQSEILSAPVEGWGPILHHPVQDFVGAIINDRSVASPPASQVMIHGVIDALYASAASGRSEEVKP
ncbi:MAG: Gfo/Idh/MocA family protein [Spartobacteria bacterium]